MALDQYYTKLRRYNGLDVTLRVGDVELSGTFIKAEQQGSATTEQLKITFQTQELSKELYRALKKMLGEPVPIRVGRDDTELVFASLSTIPTDAQFEEQSTDPIELVFSEPQMNAIATVNPSTIIKELKQAGFLSFADEVKAINARTNKLGHEKLVCAVDLLKARHKFALAEQLDQVRIKIYGESEPGQDKAKHLKALLQDVVKGYLPNLDDSSMGGDKWDLLLESLTLMVKPRLEQYARSVGIGEAPGKNDPLPQGDMPSGETPEGGTGNGGDAGGDGGGAAASSHEALGPGFTPPFTKAPQTVQYNPQAPTPQEF